MRSRSLAGKPCSSVPSAKARRLRDPMTLPTSSARSGPTARNNVAFVLQSSIPPRSIRSVGSVRSSHSPASTRASTKRRKRKVSVSMRFTASSSLRPLFLLRHGQDEGLVFDVGCRSDQVLRDEISHQLEAVTLDDAALCEAVLVVDVVDLEKVLREARKALAHVGDRILRVLLHKQQGFVIDLVDARDEIGILCREIGRRDDALEMRAIGLGYAAAPEIREPSQALLGYADRSVRDRGQCDVDLRLLRGEEQRGIGLDGREVEIGIGVEAVFLRKCVEDKL